MNGGRASAGPPTGSSKPATVSLQVLDTGRTGIRPSRSSPRRAAVLIAVNVLIAAHIVQWLVMGMTISPVEPSESMDTLREGVINSGFVFFTLAILSTLIFGRFFCGWGCHVVALQDLCLLVMRRLKVRPKPWRTRLLVFMPLLLALYMFVWPVFHREVLTPLYGRTAGLLGLPVDMPVWMGRSAPLHGFSTAFLVEDFWATFPPWFIAVPFLLVCGFACVYFLGSKGFCTYGCPYGGFFGPVDRLSPGRIIVNESCEQSGHCTGVCTSNVRVHEEVRDFGMVVDPGCMKCLDCVSVCPNNALAFGFGTPPILAKPRDDAARDRIKARKKRTHAFDLTWPEEIAFGALFIALTISYRGMFNVIPLLMAAGIGAIATFLAWKVWRMVTTPNVRLQNLKARYRGRTTRAGLALATAGSAAVLMGAWSSVVQYHLWRGSMLDASLTIGAERVLTVGYTPDPMVLRVAERAVGHYRIAGPPSDGGIGWTRRPTEEMRYAWLLSVAGRLDEAQAVLLGVADRHGADMVLVESILLVMRARGATGDDLREILSWIADRHPKLLPLQVLIARDEARSGLHEEALGRLRRVVAEAGDDVASLGPAVELMVSLGRVDEALSVMSERVARSPRRAELRLLLGMVTAASGDRAGALAQLETAAKLAPDNPTILLALADLLEASGDTTRADRLRKQILEQHGG